MKKILLLSMLASYSHAASPIKMNVALVGSCLMWQNWKKILVPTAGGSIVINTNFKSSIQIFGMFTSNVCFGGGEADWQKINISYGIKAQMSKDLALYGGLYHHYAHLTHDASKFGAQAIIEYNLSSVSIFVGYGYIPFGRNDTWHEVMIGLSKKLI